MKRGTRILSMALAVLLCVSLVPVSALEEEEAPEPVVIELPGIVEEETPVEEEAPAEEETPAVEEPSAEEELPVEEETPVTDGAATSGTCGDNLTWTLSDDGTLTISGTGAMADYEGYMTGVGTAPWYDYRDSITSVVIESGVKTIGANAFYGCLKLTDVTLADTVYWLCQFAFVGCIGLTGVDLPASLKYIGEGAFCGSGLTEIVIPDSVTEIGWWAFSGCTGLTQVVIPKSVTEIQYDAFDGCTKLKRIHILNPDCVIAGDESTLGLVDTTVIYGFEGSTAETYAETFEQEFAKLLVKIGETNFPDAAFRSYISTSCDTDGDGCLSQSEALNGKEFRLSGRNIVSLVGIEYFTALEYLDCSDNALTTLDVSKNTALKELRCYGNEIYSLDISDNENLIAAANGSLVEADSVAVVFYASERGEWLYYNYHLGVDYYTEIVVSGEVLNQEFVDDGRIPEDTILTAINETAFPDDVFRGVVEAFDTDGDGNLSKGEANQVGSLSLGNKEIASVQGIEYFSRLSLLFITRNDLTEVDLGGNPVMRKMLQDAGGVKEGKAEYMHPETGVSFLQVDEGVAIHCYRQWQETKAAACTETGEKRAACDWCESVKTRSIPATGHVWDSAVVTVKPTLENEGAGQVLYSCANCTETKTEDIGYFVGDVDGDGDVDVTDLVCLIKYILGDEVTVNPATVNTTGDESVNILDVIRLMRMLSSVGEE